MGAGMLLAICWSPGLAAAQATTPAGGGSGPIVVRPAVRMLDILEVHDDTEMFEFSGVLTLTWNDPARAFDPVESGVQEKLYQGAFQVSEQADGWYPEMILTNAAGAVQSNGVMLRVRSDGTCILEEALIATAEVDLDMRRFPFDRHRLVARFEVLGHGTQQTRFEAAPDVAESILASKVEIPQWQVRGAGVAVAERPAPYAHPGGTASELVIHVDVARGSFHAVRLVFIPLVVIVFLSFSVFWMDKSSLGDRVNVSFIGILTGVTFQILITDSLPRLSYFTLVHGFLNLSFFTMCSTVVINLVVSGLDRRGKQAEGDRLDRVCRWVFPLTYVGLNLVMVCVAFVFF